jgi:signal transduction histidine kinase
VQGNERGSGIGLSIVSELVTALGGEIQVHSEESRGSRFEITLPFEPAETSEIATWRSRPSPRLLKPGTAEPAATPEPDAPRATILVAEDEPSLAREIQRILSRHWKVIVAPDGVQALADAEKYRPDLLLTDIGMPRMDGLELTRRFRDLPGNRIAPVLFLSAYSEIRTRLAGLEAGALDYLTKPFDPDELVGRIRGLLRWRRMALQLHETEKLTALGTLSAGLAHEFRNPANGVINAVAPLRKMIPEEVMAREPGIAELLDVVDECSRQIGSLSRELLGYARGGDISGEEVAYRTVIDRATAMVEPSMVDVEIQDHGDYDGNIVCATAFAVQILANLLENAAHAAGPGGWVRIETLVRPDALTIRVSDSGPGVPPDLQQRVFDPFFTTKDPGVGTGLGLFTARRIAESHGGSLELHDRGPSDGGTAFELTLPRPPAVTKVPPHKETGS